MKIKLLVATHKSYEFPDDPIYQPIEVGAGLRDTELGYLCDDNGQNISDKNGSFSELTALYWAWKNSYFNDADYAGMVHYRRYFSGSEGFGKFKILDKQDIEKVLSEYDVIVPTRRNYYIETIRDHYRHAHYAKDLDTLEEVLQEYSPEYIDAFAKVMESRSLFLYNMFVMKSKYFEAYCTWLFGILFEVEKRVDISKYDRYQSRVFGFLSERMFNVWILHHKLRAQEVKVVNLEGENLIVKAINMLKRKYLAGGAIR